MEIAIKIGAGARIEPPTFGRRYGCVTTTLQWSDAHNGKKFDMKMSAMMGLYDAM